MLISDLLNEVNREMALRNQVFPRLIKAGRLTEGEATERMDRMKAVHDVLMDLKKQGCIQLSDVICSDCRQALLNNGTEKALKSIIIKGGAQ